MVSAGKYLPHVKHVATETMVNRRGGSAKAGYYFVIACSYGLVGMRAGLVSRVGLVRSLLCQSHGG